jgi:DNA-binding NarL/FixJ family response regulator
MDARVAPISVLIADDQPILRDALVDFINLFDDLRVLAAVASGAEAIEMVRAEAPDVALVDIRMPGGGPDLVRAIHQAAPSTRVLVVSASGGQQIVMEMLLAGADGYLVKGEMPIKVVEGIQAVAAGGRPVSPELLDDEVRALLARPRES